MIEKFENIDNIMYFYEYEVMKWRKDRKIDFYIFKDIFLVDIIVIEWMLVMDGEVVCEIFDYDFVIVYLCFLNFL